MAKPSTSHTTTRTLPPVPLTSENERIRFVLRARIREAGFSQSNLAKAIDRELKQEHENHTAAGAQTPVESDEDMRPDKSSHASMSRAKLIYWLTNADLTVDNLEFVRRVERYGIHNSDTSRYGQRILDRSNLDRRGDSVWWTNEFTMMEKFHKPIEVIVAGLSLYQFVIERGPDAISADPDSARAIRPLTFALCRVGSGGMGYATDALTIIARLGSVVSEYVAEFMAVSPLGLWLGRAADGALRRERLGGTAGTPSRLIEDYTRAAVSLEGDISEHIPAACTGHLRLLRRVAFSGDSRASLRAARQLLAIAHNDSLSPRWRRFALWAGCEHANRYDDEFRTEFTLAARLLRSDKTLADVAEQLLGDSAEPAYQSWATRMPPDPNFDAFYIRCRQGTPEIFTWPLAKHPQTDLVLAKYTLRNFTPEREDELLHKNPNVAGLGLDLRMRFLDALHEAIVHPGIVRTQSAIDMFRAAGEAVVLAVVATIEAMLVEGRILEEWDDHHWGIVETCIDILGGMRHQSALNVLLALANPQYGQFIHARALWAIGDVFSVHERGRKIPTPADNSIASALHSALSSPAMSVQRAAIHTIAVAGLQEEFEQELVAHTVLNDPLRDWATWCYESRDQTGFLNRPPYEM